MKEVITENLNQLKEFLIKISSIEYTQRHDVLSGSTIGQHIRHILEFYEILFQSSIKGSISYDNRKRDKNLEDDPANAIASIENLFPLIAQLEEKQTLNFEGDFTKQGKTMETIPSSMGREMAYCLEHSIHHQAIIKAALIAMNLKDLVNNNFGVAYSTIRYNSKLCAQ